MNILIEATNVSARDIISIVISVISLIVSVSVVISNMIKNKRQERKEEFVKVFKKYNKRYQEYYEKMREQYDLKENGNYLLMIDKPSKFYPMSEIKVSIDKIDKVSKKIVYNKNKFPNKNEDFLSNYLSSYYEGKLRDEPSFFLTDYKKIDDKTQFSFIEHGYNEYINSGTYLEYDIANSHGHPKGRVDILNPLNRYVGVGICTMTIIKNVVDSETNQTISYFMVHERSQLLAEHPGQKAVVPAGTFEPINKNNIFADENYNIENTVYREFGEEILGNDDFSSLASVELLDDGILGEIKKASKTKYLGSGFDVMNGKLEMMGILIIDVNKMDLKYHNLTIEEFLSKIGLAPNSEGVIFTKKLTKVHLNQYANNVLCAPIARQVCKILVENFEDKSLFE